ncbi:MAG: N-6 DNA methylase [Alphaproteobacteria bacterium]|jgi:hypothetical protein|nr:N-6 DNA methylase [Alphaproteobacteria bacterium]
MTQSVNPLESLRAFARDLTANFASRVDAQPEDQLKAPVAALVKAVSTGVEVRTEARGDGIRGRPDMGVSVKSLLTGFVELKAPGKGADPTKLKGEQNKKQWQNFKAIPNLIYTDGNAWALFREGERVGRTVTLAGDVTRDGAKAVTPEDAQALAALLQDFLSWQPIVPHGPKALAEYLAPLTRFLRGEVEAAIQDPASALATLADTWRSYLFPDLDDARFADAYAQTLTYALLLARLHGAQDISDPASAARALGDGEGLLANTLTILAHPSARGEVGGGYGMLARSLSALDPHDFLKGHGQGLWLYFYEDFLAAYDKKLRADCGVYYTPAKVVQAQTRLVAQALERDFGKKYAFADEGVTFLDPAVGTGTYLVAAVQESMRRTAPLGPGMAAPFATALARNMYGLECLVGPYAVAHLRLTQAITAQGGTLPGGRLQIYLADTLESPHTAPPAALHLDLKPLAEERNRARSVKSERNILVCIGNPPYDRQTIEAGDETTQRKGGWVRYGDQIKGGADQEYMGNRPILQDFIDPVQAAGQSVHLKSIYNDYVYFWRWALWKLFESQEGGGVVSFITASSYLAGPGFIGMREVMRRTLDDLWIINLEGDNLGARKTENVFAIQTPVAIAVGVCRGRADRNTPARVRYTKVTGTRADKLAALAAVEGLESLAWQDCPSDWHAPFLPAGQGAFFDWPALTDLFPWQHSGVQFKRTWTIGETREVVEARLHTLLTAPRGDRAALFKEESPGQITKSKKGQTPVAEMKPTDAPPLMRYAFRSFDTQWAVADERFAYSLRPGLFAAQGPQQVYMATMPTKVLGQGLSASISPYLPDMDMFCGRGGKDIIPLYRDAAATQPNVTAGVLEAVSRALGRAVTAEDLFAYCYAMMAHPAYVDMFWEELSTPGPRVPLTKDSALFTRAVAAGRRLIWLHTYGERFGDGDIPPGKATCTREIKGYPQDFSYDEDKGEIRVGTGAFGPVAREVWDFEVSGFRVVKSWLSYRMKDGAGKKSSPLDDIRPRAWTAEMSTGFLRLLWVLEASVAMHDALADLLRDIAAGPCFTAADLPSPTATERAAPKAERTPNADTAQTQLL